MIDAPIDERADFPSAMGNNAVRESQPRLSIIRFHARENQVQSTEFPDGIMHLAMHRNLIKLRAYFCDFHKPCPFCFLSPLADPCNPDIWHGATHPLDLLDKLKPFDYQSSLIFRRQHEWRSRDSEMMGMGLSGRER
jgi:hypothetical protein